MAIDRSLDALNGHLHDQLGALLNPDLAGDELDDEIKRSKAVANVASKIIDSERTINERAQIVGEYAPDKLVDVLMPKGVGYNEK